MTNDKRPKVNSESQKELDRLENQFNEFEKSVTDLTLDRMNEAKKEETEPQIQIAQRDLEKIKDHYLKPEKTISAKEKFNERYREDYNFMKENVHFVAESKEVIGDNIELWTKPFAGVPAEFWRIPSNKPVWGPRYLAEQIKKCCYHRLRTEDKVIGHNQFGGDYGCLVVDTTVQRLDAQPVSKRKSVFMGAANF